MIKGEHARLRLIVTGRVQGVFFRVAALEQGRSLGLTGWVRNRGDGAVEIVAEGPPERLRMLMAWAWTGPPGARVEAVAETWLDPSGEYAGFQIRHDRGA